MTPLVAGISMLITFDPSIFNRPERMKDVKIFWKTNKLFLPSLEKRFSLFPLAIATSWWALSPALKIVLRKWDVLRWDEASNIYLLIMWFKTSLDSVLGFVISSSSSFIGRFMNAVLVGANTVQGPAINTNKKKLNGHQSQQHLLL